MQLDPNKLGQVLDSAEVRMEQLWEGGNEDIKTAQFLEECIMHVREWIESPEGKKCLTTI